jgi:PAS domain S-box-containing protein
MPGADAPASPGLGWLNMSDRNKAVLRAVYDEANHPIGFLDLAGLVRLANRSACTLIGCSESELLGRPFGDTKWWIHSPEEQAKLYDGLLRAARGENVRFETVHRVSDGSLLPFDFTLRPVREPNGKICALIAESWDISPRKASDIELQRLAQEQRTILNTVAAGLCLLKERRLQWFNSTFATMFGYEADELEQAEVRQFYASEDDFMRVGLEGYARLAQGKGYSTDALMKRKDGATFWCSISGRAINALQKEAGAIWVLRDISERRNAEVALRKSQERLEAAQELAHIGCWELDFSAGFSFWSREMFRLFNLEPASCAPSWEAFLEMIHPADRDRLVHAREQGIDVGDDINLELRSNPSLGPVRVFFTNIQVKHGATQQQRILNGTLQDVTERVRAEEALHNSERKLAEIFRSSPEMIVVSRTEDGRLFELNDTFSRILGYDHDEIIGKTSLEIGLWPSPEARAEVVEQVKKYGEIRNRESLLCKKTGEGIPVLMSASPIMIDGEKCMIWLLVDITDRKRSEAAVRESQARLEAAQRQARIGSWEFTPSTCSLYWSREMFHLLKLNEEDRAPTHEAYLAMMHPEDRPHMERFLDQVAQSDKPETCEFRSDPGSGPERRFCITGQADHNAAGQLTTLSGTLQDITEQKHAEQERAKLHEQLLQAMKMDAVGRLAGGVAHDFNNLLTVIIGNVGLACAELNPSDPLLPLLSEVAKAADSASSLTHQLLAFSRRQIIEPKVLNLSSLVGNLRKMLTRIIGEDIELRAALAEDLGSVKVDPNQFDQVVVNLVVNARDAMPGGGELLLKTANVTLDESYAQLHPDVAPGNYVMLAVSDNGQGMTDEVKQRLFEPFFTTKPQGHGTGLGLAMIFGVVKQASGTIEVYSEVGRGTTFKIYLPRIEEPAEQLERRGRSNDLPRGTETLLLVEDDPSVRSLAEKFLGRQGYKLLSASSGGEALMLADQHAGLIDLLLTDVVMPGMGGRELADRIRQRHPDISVLFTSGYTEDTIVRHGIIDEQMHFIGKPYTLQLIARKVREVLDTRHPPSPKPPL